SSRTPYPFASTTSPPFTTATDSPGTSWAFMVLAMNSSNPARGPAAGLSAAAGGGAAPASRARASTTGLIGGLRGLGLRFRFGTPTLRTGSMTAGDGDGDDSIRKSLVIDSMQADALRAPRRGRCGLDD